MDVTSPYKFIWSGDIHGPKPYKLVRLRCAFISQTPVAQPSKSKQLPGVPGMSWPMYTKDPDIAGQTWERCTRDPGHPGHGGTF